VVVNAGIGKGAALGTGRADANRATAMTNFVGALAQTEAALEIFRRQQRGHLVIVSSIVGRRGIAQMSGYSATKAAQVGFAEALRTEFAGTDIHVSVVLPVSTETEFRDAMSRDYGHSVRGLGPKQSADTVARAVVDCIRRPAPEVYPHAASRALTVINALAPGFADRLVRKYGRRREQ
jgi:short-subunit dehydrogenase